ncbi:carnitine 3-dehydrogenase [Bradyrhizobium sp. USDA 4515]
MSGRLPRGVGLLGGGVIGGGWAARFLLNGVDVRLYDPAPGAMDQVQKILANARRAYRRLTQVTLPAEGTLKLVQSIEDAVVEVELVQESAPERLELKRQLLTTASRVAARDVLICSSTSSLRPSLLQEGTDHPERVFVAHPFNPVYLLPLVELCAGQNTPPETLVRAAEIYRKIGMHPLVVRKEVDGFIANRLQEAVWREALWLVHDDLATVQEVDDAVRYSFGLRRPIVGPFLTYRMASGGTGMRQVMERFGPYLKWPLSKLTDVPELTDAFLDKFAEQSDAQARTDNITEKERDDCLVALLQGLRSQRHGAGETLARWEQGLRDSAPAVVAGDSSPLRSAMLDMPSDWLDANGHVTESRYLELCTFGTSNLLNRIGVDRDYRSKYGSYYTLETHLSHLREIRVGDRVQVLTQILGVDDKRIHLFHVIALDGQAEPAATGEQVLVHVDAGTRRSGRMQGCVRERLMELAQLHAELPRPRRAGARIALR